MKYKLSNWEEYQHYKHRNPPWVKLHFAMLSGETWVCLDDASRVLAIACMLIASRNDGHIPANPEYVRRVAHLNKKPNFDLLLSTGFLVVVKDASDLLADASTMHTNAIPEKSRVETEKRESKSRAPQSPEGEVSKKSFKKWSRDEFISEVDKNKGDYLSKMLREFAAYWLEPTGKPNKLRFHDQKAWDTKRRLSTWASRSTEPTKKKSTQGGDLWTG